MYAHGGHVDKYCHVTLDDFGYKIWSNIMEQGMGNLDNMGSWISRIVISILNSDSPTRRTVIYP